MTRTVLFLIGQMILVHPSSGRGQALDLQAAVDSIALRLTEQVSGAGPLQVATAELLDPAGNPNALGRLIADRLAVSLTARAEFRVVGRRQLERALEELGLEIANLVEPEQAAEAGAFLHCDAVLVGRISDVGDEVKVTVQLVDVENRRGLDEITALLRKNVVVEDLLRRKQPIGAERSDHAGADAGSGTDAPGAARWSSITRWGIDFTLTACPAGRPDTSLNGGTRLYCHLAVTNNPKQQDWIRVFEAGSYVSDSAGIELPLVGVYGLGTDGFYSYSSMLPRSGRPILLVLKFGGSRQLGDVVSVVIRVQPGSSTAGDLEFKRIGR